MTIITIVYINIFLFLLFILNCFYYFLHLMVLIMFHIQKLVLLEHLLQNHQKQLQERFVQSWNNLKIFYQA